MSSTCSFQQRLWVRERLVGWARDKMVGFTSRVDILRLVGLEQYGKEYLRTKEKYEKDIITN